MTSNQACQENVTKEGQVI